MLEFLFSFSVRFIIKLALWIFLFYWAVEIEFGVVFFVLSCFYFVYASMGDESEQKTPGERVSAYSVFNKGGANILGNFETTSMERSLGLPQYSE